MAMARRAQTAFALVLKVSWFMDRRLCRGNFQWYMAGGVRSHGENEITAGPPGSGKPRCALEFMATITGRTMVRQGTCCRPGGGDVVVWSGEDDPEDTLVPHQLIAAGADLDIVF